MRGYCYLLIGPMCAGKTSELVHITRKFKQKKVNIKAYKHASDTRYDDGKELCTHDQMREPCTPIMNANEILSDTDYKNTEVIVLEEGQFFGPELLTVSDQIVNVDEKYLIIAGLSGNALMKPMGHINDLVSFADEIKILTALCYYCDDCIPAPFTVKISGSDAEIEVGTDMYKPVCRHHFLEHYNDVQK